MPFAADWTRSTRHAMDDTLLADYIDTFYGYGNYAGRWWLVGMEEGGGNSPDEVQRRLRLWEERGRRELEDVNIFDGSALGKWFQPGAPLQSTWRGLIRLLLAAQGRATDAEVVRNYQAGELGREGGDTCLLELLPLPSPSIDDWLYGKHSSLPALRTRAVYRETVSPRRVDHLRARITEHRPAAVIFYSRAYRPWWEQIVGASFGPPMEPGLQLAWRSSTLFVLTKHPAGRGIGGAYFEAAGRLLADVVRAKRA